jgi:hypothetical protein
MNYSAWWRSKKALASIRCLIINTRANRVAIVCSVITRIFLPYANVGRSPFNLFDKDTCDLFMLWTMLVVPVIVVYYCCYCSIYYLSLFDICSVFHSIILFYSILLFSWFTSKYSIMILDCIPGILIPLPVDITIWQVNKHHTADCTVFVLV